MKRAMIFYGGWPGHDPELVANRFGRLLRAEDFEVEIYDTLDILADGDKLLSYDLIVPEWTQGEIGQQPVINLCNAVGHGVGLAGCQGEHCLRCGFAAGGD